MRWMVGLDIRNTSRGAVALARGFHERSSEHAFIGAHAIEEHVQAIIAAQDSDVAAELPRYVDELLQPLRHDAAFAEIGAIPATSAEDGLEAAAVERKCDGFIIGRHGPAQGGALVRLGRVARRMLRTLSKPVVVVPPDLSDGDFGDGPLLLATDLREGDSGGAARLAKRLSETLDLDLLVTTVAAPPSEAARYMPADAWETLSGAKPAATKADLDAWVAAHELGDVRTSVVEGPISTKILEVARVSGASMIVVGSRRLSTVDRIFVSSMGSHLSAHAPIPVAVVPPGYRNDAWVSARV